MTLSATYSPEDNKLRLYSSTRLDKETYERVRAAGFRWAPKQELFFAPGWSPSREDLLIELCGEIDDEDKSLVERAEERSERFQDYSAARSEDAHNAREAVNRITSGIPMGQPILVGHHSERHARKDAERIENGMRKAVKMWETSQYWKSRAAGAIAHAKYKELPAVRARRIKGIEADIRAYRAKFTPADNHVIMQEPWDSKDGVKVPHVWCAPKGGRGGSWVQASRLPELEAYYSRWIKHCENRLEYERAMLGESGGIAADKFNIEVGGQVLASGEWVTVLRVNRVNGIISSVRTTARYVPVVSIERVRDYRAPSAEESAKTQAAMKKAPICNYPGKDFRHITKADWDKRHKDYKGTRDVAATETVGRHRVRIMLLNAMSGYSPVYLADQKQVDPPAPKAETPINFVNERAIPERPTYKAPEPTEFDAMRDQLKQGVKVVSAPQLFPTPPELAKRMAELASIQAGQRVLEPSAGTGNLLRPVFNRFTGPDCGRVVAVEINPRLADNLRHDRQLRVYANEENYKIICADFLECNGDLGKFDRVLMNPPFENGSDIKHIKHALTMLKPGGKLVAICANGPRQRDALKPLVNQSGGTWEVLPADTFKDQGTGVNTVLLSIPA
jgi:protein-L-isoaspartate O-methyltransferase